MTKNDLNSSNPTQAGRTNYSGNRLSAVFVSLFAALIVPGCSGFNSTGSTADLELAGVGVQTISDPQACLEAVGAPHVAGDHGLNPQRIQSLSWNLEKGLDENALYQLGVLSSSMDLVVVQEAALNSSLTHQFPNLKYWSFAPGYQSKVNLTGVMTMSRVPALTHCVFAVTEPWLGTPKAVGLTEYALQGMDKTLLVINVHAVNFTITASALTKQLNVFSEFVDAHEGPVVVSGDFNTWSEARMQVLNDFADMHNLQVLGFEVDNRTKVFGRVLDHILVRDIEVLDTTTFQVDTSDHNALWAEFAVTGDG